MLGSIVDSLPMSAGTVSVRFLALFLICLWVALSSYLVGISLVNRFARRSIPSLGADEFEIMLPLHMAVGLFAMMMATFLVAWFMPVYRAAWLLPALFLAPIFSWRSIREYGFRFKPLLLPFAAAFLLGFYHYGLKGLTLGAYYVVPGFNAADGEMYKIYADMIRLFGLPLHDPTGVSGLINSRIGVPSIGVFFGAAFHIPIMLSMQGLAISFYFLMISSARSILVALWPDKPRWKIDLVSITPMIWGGTFSLFADAIFRNSKGLMYPYVYSKIRLLPSGSLYHNITQAGSVALSASAVLAMLLYAKFKKPGLHTIALALLCAGGLCKPSLIIALAPAAAIWHLVDKDYGALGRLLTVSAVFIVINMLLQFTSGTVQGHGDAFVFDPLHGLFRNGIGDTVMGYLNTFLMVAFVVISVRRWLISREEVSARFFSFLSVAFLGALAFPLMFRNPNPGPGNENWGLLGVTILIVPVFLFSMLERKSDNFRKLTMILAAVTLISGIIYAVNFPSGNIERIDAKLAHDLKRFGRECGVNDTLAIDPALGLNWITASLTGRKTLLDRRIFSRSDPVKKSPNSASRTTLSTFKWFLNLPVDGLYWQTDLFRRNYLIISSERLRTIEYLRQHHFVVRETWDCGAVVLKNGSPGKE